MKRPALVNFYLVIIVTGTLFSIAWTGCSKTKIDLLLYNGTIYTVNRQSEIAEAIAIKNGRIVETGNSAALMDKYDAVRKIDLEGKPVYPGFIDAHCHFFGYSSDLLKCDLTGTQSLEELLDSLIGFSRRNRFSWLLGRGWDQNDWPVKNFPDNRTLDSLFPQQPVFLMRIDGHAALCNSVALKLAGITPSTRIEGGEILCRNGRLTGLLIDNAVALVESKVPAYPVGLNESALLEGQRNCFRSGLTTVDDAGLGRDSIELLHRLQKEGKLKLRIYAMASSNPTTLNYFLNHGPVKDERMNVSAVKIYADGALGSRGACLLAPYADQSGHYGFLLNSVDSMTAMARRALEKGFQVCTHAIGDSATRTVLAIYAGLLKGKNDKRWRIEHCQVTDSADFSSYATYSIIPSVQPTHATSDMYWAGSRLGAGRIRNAYAYNRLLRAAGTLALGTDFPVEKINPLLTFYAAVCRRDISGFPEGGFQPEDGLDRESALRGMTIGAAWSNFEEKEKGSLEPGKFADLVILDKDIMNVNEKELPSTQVIRTFVNGEEVYLKQ